ncbi:MAG: hypothetical protein JSS49_10120 [Planctomycetes bacterium]|nr:hypothetical protein [Planctomycetota bacterium]
MVANRKWLVGVFSGTTALLGIVSTLLSNVAFAGDVTAAAIPVIRPTTPSPDLFEMGFAHDGLVHAARKTFGTTLTITYTGTPPALPSSGAKVINSIQVQGVYLGPAFGPGKANAGDVTYLDGFLSYIVGSSYMSALAPYGVSTGTAVPGKVLTGTLPHYSSRKRVYLTDTQIQNILVANIGSLMAPADNTLYVVYTEPGVAIDAGGGATSINTFLGYHNYASFTSGGVTQSFAYAVMPYPGSPNPKPTSQGFSNARDELTSVTSHEICEAATDPDTMNGWWETVIETATYKNSRGQIISQRTYYYTGEEIGDVPLMLYNWSSTCYVRLGSYLVQRMIGPDGKTMLSYSGSTPKATSIHGLLAPAALHAANQVWQELGFNDD